MEPVLNVLCNKTLQISLLEVLEEQELKTMHDEQIRFRQLKKQELEETNQQEEKEESLRKKNEEIKA